MQRQLYMGGGITGLPTNEMMVPRGQYGLGSIVKSITKPIKKAVSAVGDFAKSDIGKAAILAAIGFGIPGTSIGGLFGRASFGGAATGLFGQQGIGATLGAIGPKLLGSVEAGTGLYGGGPLSGIANAFQGANLSSLVPGKGALLSAGLGFLGGTALGGALTPKQIEAGMKRNPTAIKQYLAQYYKNLNQNATEEEANQYAEEQTREYAAQGGLMGRQEYGMGGMITELINENPEIFKQLQMASPMKKYIAQYYGNLNPGKSVEEIEEYVRENSAQGGRIGFAMGDMPMGEPRQNQGGIMELDYRDNGGFVPIGIKEKADDVPAMLSKNEFVFTADAVRGAGNGDIERGAEKLYNTMKTLENGGTV